MIQSTPKFSRRDIPKDAIFLYIFVQILSFFVIFLFSPFFANFFSFFIINSLFFFIFLYVFVIETKKRIKNVSNDNDYDNYQRETLFILLVSILLFVLSLIKFYLWTLASVYFCVVIIRWIFKKHFKEIGKKMKKLLVSEPNYYNKSFRFWSILHLVPGLIDLHKNFLIF